MDGMIKCAVCGENNSTELDYCQKCNSPLRQHDETLKPGELPNKKKNTAELEPILPQWLRDAREQSRQVSEDDLSTGMQSNKPSSHAETPASNVDFLAGLGSHADDDNEDETPDWLASITGVSNKPKKSGTETSDVRWIEMGGKDDFAQDAPAQDAESDTPSWLANIQSQPKTEKDELTDWFKEAASPSTQDSDWMGQSKKTNDFMSQDQESVSSSDTPDWLRQMQADDAPKNEPTQAPPSFNSNDDTPDWLKSMGAADAVQSTRNQAAEPSFDGGDDAPDWLKRMDESDSAKNTSMDAGPSFSTSDDAPAWLQQPNTQQPVDDDVPAWLNTMDSEQKIQSLDPSPFSGAVTSGDDAAFSLTEDTPDWLKSMPSEEPKASPLKGTSPLWLRDEGAAESADANVPAWLSSNPPMGEQPAFNETKAEPAENEDIPSWLKAAAPQSSIFSEPAVESDQVFSSDTPDWLSAFKSVEGAQTASPFSGETQLPDNDLPAPAFTENSFEGLGDNSLFTEMPDWLSNAADTPAAESIPAINNADSLAAGELPSWVQAMRPVEGSRPGSSGSTDQTLESRGALAGLQGVLPSVPGFAPSSKPKAYSILLQATEEQRSHALLLEQILAAEAEPQPIASYAPLAASRPLRWFIAVAVLVAVTTVTALGTQWFGMPFLSMDVPNELSGALDVARNVPEGAPVLVVMDYRPSHAAELEAAAAPMLDQMDLLRHPKLVFISTNEMGSILTQRLLSLPSLKDRYRGEGQFTNLGYLPGGELGIRAFVQNPFQTMPVDVFQNSTAASLQEGGISIAQFVAVLVLTDNADSGRLWIEQAAAATSPLPFTAPMVMITSAQAGPMIQPYYVSGQVKGIVNGLYGSAIFEQNNAGRPGTARSYWDAYSLGMLLAMLLLVLGGLWNLALGVRDRSAAGGAI